MQFTEEDFMELEKRYPEGYWYLYSAATTRMLKEKEQELKLRDEKEQELKLRDEKENLVE